MKIAAVKDKVLVQMDERKEEVGGIFIPDKLRETREWGIVVSVGSEVSCRDLRMGDTVYIAGTQGTQIAIGNRDYIFINEDKIMGRRLRPEETA